MRWARATVAMVLLVAGGRAAAQDLGHKLLGTLGLQAGAQPTTGVYLANRFVLYRADELYGNDGRRLPVGLDLQAVADAVGVAGAYELPRLHTFVNASVAVPLAHAAGTIDHPAASIDRFGLADVYVQPLKLGWRLRHLDLVVGYAFYVPTGRFEPGGADGVSRGSWSHELSLGHTVYVGARRYYVSALASWELHQRKIGIDLTRGSTVQLQGGAGATLLRIVDVGVVGYGVWQVADDTGRALPPALRGLRDRAGGLGAELDVTLPDAQSRIVLRWTHDVAAAARPGGQLLLIGLTWAPWQARRR